MIHRVSAASSSCTQRSFWGTGVQRRSSTGGSILCSHVWHYMRIDEFIDRGHALEIFFKGNEEMIGIDCSGVKEKEKLFTILFAVLFVIHPAKVFYNQDRTIGKENSEIRIDPFPEASIAVKGSFDIVKTCNIHQDQFFSFIWVLALLACF